MDYHKELNKILKDVADNNKKSRIDIEKESSLDASIVRGLILQMIEDDYLKSNESPVMEIIFITPKGMVFNELGGYKVIKTPWHKTQIFNITFAGVIVATATWAIEYYMPKQEESQELLVNPRIEVNIYKDSLVSSHVADSNAININD